MSIDLKDKMQTLQSQYQQVLESLANGEIMRRKLEGAMELTQSIIEEGKALQDGALEKEEAKKVVKKAK